MIGLDIAGVDLVAQDISRPLAEQGAAIVEINAGPGLLMHLKPAEGKPRPVGKAIVDSLFAEGDNGRIPIVGVAGTHSQTLAAQIVARLLQLSGSHVGLACADGLYFAQRQTDKRDCANWASAQKVLLNRSVQAVVIENGCDTILGEGLCYDRCQVGIITDIEAAHHFGKFYVETSDQVSTVFRTQVDVVLSEGVAVLNADDPLVATMAEYCDGEVMFFSKQGETQLIASHLQQQGRAVILSDGHVVCVKGGERTQLIKLAQLTGLHTRNADRQMDSLLAGVAAAWALGISHELIRAGMTTFVFKPSDI